MCELEDGRIEYAGISRDVANEVLLSIGAVRLRSESRYHRFPIDLSAEQKVFLKQRYPEIHQYFTGGASICLPENYDFIAVEGDIGAYDMRSNTPRHVFCADKQSDSQKATLASLPDNIREKLSNYKTLGE